MPDERPTISPRLLMGLIMGGGALWALYVAVGVYFSTFNVWRAALVLVCMAVFLGFWLLLLWKSGGPKRS
jgi:ABC-type transport system involved in Fe-S cluster assembly fused permease/ATPase subunit